MKRTAAAFLAALMLMSLVACGEKEPEMTDEEKIAYIAQQLVNTSWMVQGSPISTVYTFTINFDKDLSFHLYGESLLHEKTEVECDADSGNISVSFDVTGHNIGIETRAGKWKVSIGVLCDENLRLEELGLCVFDSGGIAVTGNAEKL
ncbi:MAG: hypothetical protein MR837_03555 [Firmicutes bacterium]|nr:hypothetical protein [Bacillota bacterium]